MKRRWNVIVDSDDEQPGRSQVEGGAIEEGEESEEGEEGEESEEGEDDNFSILSGYMMESTSARGAPTVGSCKAPPEAEAPEDDGITRAALSARESRNRVARWSRPQSDRSQHSRSTNSVPTPVALPPPGTQIRPPRRSSSIQRGVGAPRRNSTSPTFPDEEEEGAGAGMLIDQRERFRRIGKGAAEARIDC